MMESLLLEAINKKKSVEDKARDTPSAANQVQYPEEFNNGAPVITARPWLRAKTATIIIATQSKGYTEESFQTDVRETVRYFQLEEGMYKGILLKPVANNNDILDSVDATEKMREVVKMMNSNTVLYKSNMEQSTTAQLRTGETIHGRAQGQVIVTTAGSYTLRIVSPGVKTSGFIFKGLEYLLNHWQAPTKSVQFITNGELEKDTFQDFWTSACVNEVVEAVQFVNLSRYLPFGYFKGKCSKLNKTGHDDQAAAQPADQPGALLGASTYAIMRE
jgi:hypothetical protein